MEAGGRQGRREADITQVERIDRRAARVGAWLAAALAADAAAFAALWPLVGNGAAVLGVVPAAFGGWLFGPLAGLAVVAVVAVLNVVQIVILAGPEAATSDSRPMVAVAFLLQVGFAVGLGMRVSVSRILARYGSASRRKSQSTKRGPQPPGRARSASGCCPKRRWPACTSSRTACFGT